MNQPTPTDPRLEVLIDVANAWARRVVLHADLLSEELVLLQTLAAYNASTASKAPVEPQALTERWERVDDTPKPQKATERPDDLLPCWCSDMSPKEFFGMAPHEHEFLRRACWPAPEPGTHEADLYREGKIDHWLAQVKDSEWATARLWSLVNRPPRSSAGRP